MLKSKTTQQIVSSIAVLFFLFTLSSKTFAQVSTAQLQGTVQDDSGAAVSGATVTLKSASKGSSNSVDTDSEGNYIFPQVLVDTYSIEVTKQGFKRFERSNIKIDVNQKARVDVTLNVGQLTETVSVSASAALVNTTDGEVGQVVTQKNIVDLPLKGRQFLELAFLTPGAVDAPTDYRRSLQGIAPAVNGVRPEYNSYTLNGASNSESYAGQFAIVPSVDAIEEFKIQSGSYNPEFGRASGAIVNVVTKAGTNEFHGSVYEFFRNDVLNARNFFNPSKSPLRLNQYGGTLGGPVYLPRFGEGGPAFISGKNRTFFFFNYEEYKERRASTRSSRFPTQAELSGDFSGSSAVVRDPETGLQFPGNRIPESRIDPVAKRYLTIFPQVTAGLAGGRNFINNSPSSYDNRTIGIRLDHRFTGKSSLYGVLNWNNIINAVPGPIPNGPGDIQNNFYNRLVNITHNYIFSSMVFNEARVSYQRFRNPFTDLFPHRDYPSELGLIGITPDPFVRNRWPAVSFGQGYSGIPRSYEATQTSNVYSFNDNLSLIRGRHNMKFGFQYFQTRITEAFITDAPTGWTFSGIFSGNAVADFLLGVASGNTTFVSGGKAYLRNSQYQFYAQDQWRATNNLTLNYGVRYELHTPWYDVRGGAGSFNRLTGAILITSLSPDQSDFSRRTGIPIERLPDKSFYKTNYCCIGPVMPRVSFAWNMQKLSGLVLRGGYGVSLNNDIGNIINGGFAPPFWNRLFATSIQYPGIGFNRGRASFENLNTGSTFDLQPIDPDFEEGYFQTWNLTAEMQLRNGMFLSLAYVGNKGTHLAALGTVNEAPPGPGPLAQRRPFTRFSTFTVFDNFGDSNYHSLQAKAEKRFDNGFGYLMSYTYGKALGNSGTLNEVRLQTSFNERLARGRLPFDVRQKFTAAVIYEMPFGRGKPFLNNAPGLVNVLLGGWQTSVIYVAQSGYPLTPGVSPSLRNGGFGPQTSNLIGPDYGNLPRGERTVDRWFNTGAFVAPPPFTFGTAPLFSLDGPGINNWDISFTKNTLIKEGLNLQFRAELYNAFNHTRFAAVDTTLGSSSFGRVQSAIGEREIQFAMKLIF